MRYNKNELMKLLEDEEDDCVVVFEFEGKEVYISKAEFETDGLTRLIMKSR